ncbi:hypothetical protein SAMN05216464_1025 [Mucilaginibacter pineti]|uniref:Uncharacterized protein n=1 Tax=Mucilaginibacter pineti TaxID=1391627 RepID=A0A1G6W0S9_9SPHI|nr:hypothetical protein [Mucilaginibacter pineti]SDD59398.1 hypothetical protein SAMN05216464_1025 [Mucilaginibacter pineti]
MTKRIFFLLLIAAFSACNKNNRIKPGCSTGICTDLFATINIHYVDHTGAGIGVKNFIVKNLRTGLPVKAGGGFDYGASSGIRSVADDGNLNEFSLEGDEVQVSATDSLTNQTIVSTLKISGGCTCHIEKLSGPDTVKFD